jgi:hypothetical protein
VGDAYLCPSCTRDLAERLEQLPALYAGLGIMLVPPTGSGGRGATMVVSPLPLVPEVADARSAFGILPTWARALADDRDEPPPVPAGPDLGHQVAAACAALTTARDWIANAWPAAGDCAREIRDLHYDARTVVGAPDLAARMGRCPTVRDGAVCGAELLLPHGEQVVRCRWCSATAQGRAFSPAGSPAAPEGPPRAVAGTTR